MKIKNMIYCALFAALTAVLSQIAIPVDPIPINLATLSVLLAGSLLGAKGGAVSQIVYVLLGTAGLPVFSAFRGGPGILIGPTGGYIAGYILGAWLTGFLSERYQPHKPLQKHLYCALCMCAGLLGCYLLGTIWFLFLTKSTLLSAVSACVLPFLPGDALKILVATLLAVRLRPIIQKYTAPEQADHC